MSFINYHLDLQSLTTAELKKALRNKKHLNANSQTKIQTELLRRDKGYYR